jgi:hypothetical protein
MDYTGIGSASFEPPQFKTIDGLQIRYAASSASHGDPILPFGTWPERIYAYLPSWEVFTSLGPVVAADSVTGDVIGRQ